MFGKVFTFFGFSILILFFVFLVLGVMQNEKKCEELGGVFKRDGCYKRSSLIEW